MNKKQWQREYSTWRAFARTADCSNFKQFSKVWAKVKSGAPECIYYSLTYRNVEVTQWASIDTGRYTSHIYATLNMQLPANHRGHLA